MQAMTEQSEHEHEINVQLANEWISNVEIKGSTVGRSVRDNLYTNSAYFICLLLSFFLSF